MRTTFCNAETWNAECTLSLATSNSSNYQLKPKYPVSILMRCISVHFSWFSFPNFSIHLLINPFPIHVFSKVFEYISGLRAHFFLHSVIIISVCQSQDSAPWLRSRYDQVNVHFRSWLCVGSIAIILPTLCIFTSLTSRNIYATDDTMYLLYCRKLST